MTAHLDKVEITVKLKIKLSHYRTGYALRIPEK
jgi:hypothetical protein